MKSYRSNASLSRCRIEHLEIRESKTTYPDGYKLCDIEMLVGS